MIQSLGRGLELLDFMAGRGGEVSVAEAARYLGVDRSTGSRLLATLKAHGYVEQDSLTQRYRLGTKLIQLSTTLLQSLNLSVLGHDVVRSLVEETGESSHIAILVGPDAVFIDHVDGREALTINANVGDRDPVYCTAVGRALLVGLSDAEVRDLLAPVQLLRFTRKTVGSIDELLDRLRVVRAQGYAFDDEERHNGVQCIAAPVFDHTARVVSSIGISVPTSRMLRATEAVLARAVLSSSRQLSSRLGFTAHVRQPATEAIA